MSHEIQDLKSNKEIKNFLGKYRPTPSPIQTKDMTGDGISFSLYKETRGIDASSQCWHVHQLQDMKKFKKLHKSALKAIVKRHNKSKIKSQRLSSSEQLDGLWDMVNDKINSDPIKNSRNQGIWNPQGRKHLPGEGCKCYICGFEIKERSGTHQIKHPEGGQCEHIIPVASLATVVTIPKNEYIYSIADLILNDTNINEAERLERFKQIIVTRTILLVLLFDWAHPCCNIIKSDYPFFDIDYSHTSGFKLTVNHKTIMWTLCKIFGEKSNPDPKTTSGSLHISKIWNPQEIDHFKLVNKRYDKVTKHLQGIANIINGLDESEKISCQYYSLQILQNTVNKKSQIFRWNHQERKGIQKLRKVFGKSLYRQKLIKSIKTVMSNPQGGGSSSTSFNISQLDRLNDMDEDTQEEILTNIFIEIKERYDKKLNEIVKAGDESSDSAWFHNRGEHEDDSEFILQFYLDYLYDSSSSGTDDTLNKKDDTLLIKFEEEIKIPVYLTRKARPEEIRKEMVDVITGSIIEEIRQNHRSPQKRPLQPSTIQERLSQLSDEAIETYSTQKHTSDESLNKKIKQAFSEEKARRTYDTSESSSEIPIYEKEQLKQLTKTQIKIYAKTNGIEIPSKMRKSEMIDHITQSQLQTIKEGGSKSQDSSSASIILREDIINGNEIQGNPGQLFPTDITGIFMKIKGINLDFMANSNLLTWFFEENYLMETYLNSLKIIKKIKIPFTQQATRYINQSKEIFGKFATFTPASLLGIAMTAGIVLYSTSMSTQSQMGGKLKNKKHTKKKYKQSKRYNRRKPRK